MRLSGVVTKPLPMMPRTRGECANVPRPCPYNLCRYHLEEFRLSKKQVAGFESCALDVAERGPQSLQAVADITGLSVERVRQIETEALAKGGICFEKLPLNALL